MKKFIITALALVAASSCSAGPTQEENLGELEQGVCSQLQCPQQGPPGYPTFRWSVNTSQSGPINCVYQSATCQWCYAQIQITKAQGCSTCCAPIYCPDPRYGQMVPTGTWNCGAP